MESITITHHCTECGVEVDAEGNCESGHAAGIESIATRQVQDSGQRQAGEDIE